MGLGKTLQSLITVALITLELAVMKDSVQQNNRTNQINNENNKNNKNDVSTNMKNNTNDANDAKNTKNTKNVNNTINGENPVNSVIVGRSLVICPASLALHWEGEIKKFFPYGNLLISELYTNNGSSSASNDGNNSSNYSNDNNNKNNNKNSKNSLESDPSSSFSPSVVVVASYDSVRKNHNNYFTNQVRITFYFYLISCCDSVLMFFDFI
jgi:SNF2 family DNA or RNA helicase